MREGEFWIETYTGRRFDILAPKRHQFSFLDIAHSLSMQVRYNGHVDRFYSVAEHSILVAAHVWRYTDDPHVAYAALFHDAAEAYTGDWPSPFKGAVPALKAIEQNIQLELWKWLNIKLNTAQHPIINDIDKRICVDERAQLMTNSGLEWETSYLKPVGAKIECMAPSVARDKFLDMGGIILQEMGL